MSSSIPPMTMYFHSRESEVILFRSWLPTTFIGYMASLLAVFALSFGYEMFRVYRAHLFRAASNALSACPPQSLVIKHVHGGGGNTLDKKNALGSACCDCVAAGGDDDDDGVDVGGDEREFAAIRGDQRVVRGRVRTISSVASRQNCSAFSNMPAVCLPSPPQTRVWHGAQSSMHFAQLALGFLLMMIAMTYNVGLFAALCVGHVAGFVAVGACVGGALQDELKTMDKLGATKDCCCS